MWHGLSFAPQSLVRAVGQWYFTTSKRYPHFFLIIPILGIAVGLWVSLFADGEIPRLVWIAFGIFLLAFYGMLIVMFFVKRTRGTWDAFCDFCIGVFED